MIGVFFYDRFYPPPVRVLLPLLVKIENHAGAVRIALGLLDIELALAVARPPVRLVLSRLSARNLNPLRHHKRRGKSDPELADKVGILARVPGKLLHEPPCARLRYGAQVFLELLFRHADPAVRYGEGLSLFVVVIYVDAGIKIDALVILVRQGEILEPVQRV